MGSKQQDVWKHGKYIDLWSVVHFLSGALLASFFFYLGLDLFWSSTFTLVILLGWEFFESVLGILETTSNVVVDIIIGLVGFLLFARFHYFESWAFDWRNFISLLLLTLALSGWGFVDFLKRGYR
ncbi:MAG: hypothetical protein AAB690_01290 [Patescibacteria group bacterium]